MIGKTIAVVGASSDRRKFGNKCVRAFVSAGWMVYPIHPSEASVEGLRAYPTVADVPVDHVDVVSMYLNPRVGIATLPSLSAKSVGQVWLNPGAESEELLALATTMGLHAIAACSIVGYGMSPYNFSDD